MTVQATIAAEARSTYVVNVAFKDEDGAAVVPTAIRWSLRNEANAVINTRDNEVVASPASEIDIVLSGDDLVLQDLDNRSEIRRLIVAATYNSTLGNGLPLMGALEFRVLNTYAMALLPSVSPSASTSPSASAS